ncbi:hypothetical protein EST38_g7054 [Candolleomyces aberdarensis]|uniref:F-box domain-containing protein n=1 Tax=Candolleomyces aberdarensis TaxID=2316362 RepID=A0A4Q2DI84_9AGAR|nr:hypothetical protein EST38_g7054 [Candolleomyces aberdarensis]
MLNTTGEWSDSIAWFVPTPHPIMQSQAFASFYHTNYVPSDKQLLDIKQLLVPHESKLAQLELDIKAAEAAVARLKRERKVTLRMIRPLRGLSSIIRRLPPEIMGRIFVHSKHSDGYSSFNTCDAPLVLLRVCRSWREIALNTPQLWSSFEITIPSHLCYIHYDPDLDSSAKHQQRQESFLEEVDRWLKRSGGRPLYIALFSECFQDEKANVYGLLNAIRWKLVDHASRWKSIDYDLIQETGRDPLQTPIANVLKSLKEVRLSNYLFPTSTELSSDQKFQFHYDNILRAPGLEKLHLQSCWGHPYPYNFTHLPVNWSNLTSLTLGTLSSHYFKDHFYDEVTLSMWSELIPILPQCTKLRHCSLLLPSDGSSEPPSPDSHVTLFNLEALHLSGCSQAIDSFLPTINTPHLREFHYQPLHPKVPGRGRMSTPRPPLALDSSLLKFLQQVGENLEVFSFDPPSTPNEVFLACFKNIPFLKQLTIGSTFHTQAFVPDIGRAPHEFAPVASEDYMIFNDFHLESLTPTKKTKVDSGGGVLDDFGYLCAELEILRCSIRSTVTKSAVLAFLNAKAFPDHHEHYLDGSSVSSSSEPPTLESPIHSRKSKFQELSLAGLQLDGPFCPGVTGEIQFDDWEDSISTVTMTTSLHSNKSDSSEKQVYGFRFADANITDRRLIRILGGLGMQGILDTSSKRLLGTSSRGEGQALLINYVFDCDIHV